MLKNLHLQLYVFCLTEYCTYGLVGCRYCLTAFVFGLHAVMVWAFGEVFVSWFCFVGSSLPSCSPPFVSPEKFQPSLISLLCIQVLVPRSFLVSSSVLFLVSLCCFCCCVLDSCLCPLKLLV